MMSSFFADSYALIEILKGNNRYLPYMDGKLVTTEFNLCEVAFAINRDYPAATTKKILSRVRKMTSLITPIDEDYCDGALLRRTTTAAGKKLSTIDCVGYAVSRRQDVLFLTGDHEFEDMEHVEFVR